jgi:hypothetical protein
MKMSASQRIGIVLLIGLAFIFGSAWQFAGAQVEKAKSVQRWEYQQTYINDGPAGATQLSKLGEDGWELVSAYSYGPESAVKHRCILKRPT